MVLSSVCFTSLEILREILSFFDSKIIFLEGIKNSISNLSKNLSKLARCKISWRVESANVRKLFASFESRGSDYLWSISLFDYKAMENTKTLLTAVRRIPRCVHFTRQSIRSNESPSKKMGKKNANPDFSHFIFPTFVKMRFFFSNGPDFFHRWKKQF